MKHKTLREASATILAELNSNDKQFFTLSEALNILYSSDSKTVNILLGKMIERGLLMRIKNGLYHIIPYEKNPDTYQPDWHITAMHLIDNCDFYIGYFSALSIHNLTTQPLLKEQIVINKLTELLLLKIDNIKIQFDNVIYINNFKLIHL